MFTMTDFENYASGPRDADALVVEYFEDGECSVNGILASNRLTKLLRTHSKVLPTSEVVA